jgi:hypothetical protein
MGLAGTLFIAAALTVALLVLHARWRVAVRAEFVRSYTLPVGLFDKLRQRHPNLTVKDCQLTAHALRQFFLAHLKSGKQFVSMPSQVVDDLWHEFILYTKNYDHFCRRAFGRFLHHSPAAVLSSSKLSNVGLRRTWWYSCLEENINPRVPTRLPLLFAIDGKLKIENGFIYAADCKGLRKGAGQADSGAVIYCGGDFGTPGGDGSTEGFGDSGSGETSHAGSDSGGGHDSGGHGCGGHGCGGGGCGGGH